jgi:NADH-quinone oxidoreductase subunit K
MILVVLSCALFGVGLFGVLARRDIVAVLASVEVMLGGPLLLLVGLGSTARPPAAAAAAVSGKAALVEGVALLVIVVAACEAAVGLALLVAVARTTRTTVLEDLKEVKG